ncbi:hypothetical protein ACFQYP_15865 [Nonomuraea antimicrobica]
MKYSSAASESRRMLRMIRRAWAGSSSPMSTPIEVSQLAYPWSPRRNSIRASLDSADIALPLGRANGKIAPM